MYTFGILALLGFMTSGIFFGKRIKENQFKVALIVLSVTFLGTMVVNGIIGLDQPFEKMEIKKKELRAQTGHVDITKDSTLKLSPIYIDFESDLDRNGEPDDNWIDVDVKGADITWYGDNKGKMERVNLAWLPEGDSIPYMLIEQKRRVIKDKRWVTNFGVPNGNKYYTLYLPNDSIHNLLIEQIEQNFNKDEKYQIAKLD